MPGDTVVAAVDLGGTRMKGALVADPGEVIFDARRETPADAGPEAVIEALVGFADMLISEGRRRSIDVAAVGVAVPGIVDEARGLAVLSANLGWRNVPLRALLATRLGMAVAFGHDVRAGGLAEVRLGAAPGAVDALFVPIGTGIAAAVLAGGQPLTAGGYAGELGHVVVDPMGADCRCGGRGCLETVASAAAIAGRYAELTGRPVTGAADVAAALAAGDAAARAVWDQAVDALAGALATCASLLAPEVVVLGGGLAESDELLLAPLRSALDARLSFQRRPRIVRGKLGDAAGCLGAALVAIESLS